MKILTLIIALCVCVANTTKAQFKHKWKLELVKIECNGDAQIYGEVAIGFVPSNSRIEIPLPASNGALINDVWQKNDYKENSTKNTQVFFESDDPNIKVSARIYFRIRESDSGSPDDDFNFIGSDFGNVAEGIDILPAPDGAKKFDNQTIRKGYHARDYDLSNFSEKGTEFRIIAYEDGSSPSDHAHFYFKLTYIPADKKINNTDDAITAENAIKAKNLTVDCRFTGNNQIARINSKVSNKPIWLKIYDNDARIYYSPENGRTYFTKGEISKYYTLLNTTGKSIGSPTIDYLPTIGKPGGVIQKFEGGTLVWSPNTQTHVIWGLILAKWNKISADYTTGFPKTDEISLGNNSGVKQDFENGSFYYKNGEAEAYFLKDDINNKYNQLNGKNGVLGFPNSDITIDAPKNGAIQWFERGAMYYNPKSGAHYIPKGSLYDVYGANGFQTGKLGYPTADPKTLDGVLSQEFEGGLINGTRVILNTAPDYTKFKNLLIKPIVKFEMNKN